MSDIQYVVCGDCMVELKPTPALRWLHRMEGNIELRFVLQQKWEAAALQQDGTTVVSHVEWRDVPQVDATASDKPS